MAKKVEVSYNPQLGYLETVFKHDYDFLTGVVSYELQAEEVVFEVETYQKRRAKVVIGVVSDKSIRFQMYPYEKDDVQRNEIFNFACEGSFEIEETEEFINLISGNIRISVRKHPWEVSYYYKGKSITKEQIKDSNVDNMCKNLPIGFSLDKNKEIVEVHETMYMYSDESFYGFGEKFTDFNKRGQRVDCWQTDALSTNTNDSYKNHPFFVSSRGYAILLNSYTRSQFDMGTISGVAYNFKVEDKYLDYTIIFGDDYKENLKSYIDITENIPLIPKWAFGLWMSKCSYQNQNEIFEVVKKAEERNIKIDVIHIDGWQQEGDAGSWEWDRERFPDPQGMINYLKKHNIHLSLWMFPYIDENSQYFKFAENKGYLIKDKEGQPVRFYSTATSQSKVGCFDFTNPHFISWYKERVKKVISMGVGVIKTDFSEVVPEYAVYYDGLNGVQGHNKLTYLYAKTIYDIMAEVKEETGEKAMLWGRSGYAGSHAIPAAWAGDSSTHLNNHACILRGGLSIAMSGVAFWGFDMGGFYNTDHDGYECMPTIEEYLRSCQFGFLSPLSRCHGKTPREPWNYGEEAEDIFRQGNEFRHRILPYLYTMSVKAHKESEPMLRPLVMEYAYDQSTKNIDLEYMLGDSLLVAPVFDQERFTLYLPEGNWLDINTYAYISGAKWHEVELEKTYIPTYLKEDAYLPLLCDIPENIEEAYGEMDLVVNLKKGFQQKMYDDNAEYSFEVSIEERSVSIKTDIPIRTVKLFCKTEFNKVLVNGVEVSFNKEEEARYLVSLK